VDVVAKWKQAEIAECGGMVAVCTRNGTVDLTSPYPDYDDYDQDYDNNMMTETWQRPSQ
jgi:hypothetical protein